MTSIDAILLAGGRSSRMQGTDKVMLELAGQRLLERAIEAAHEAGCASIVVVGPHRELDVGADVAFQLVREDPPFSGPVAGLAAAKQLGEGDWILLLATDTPRIAEVVAFLRDAINAQPDVSAHLIEAQDGHLEWLCSAMRRTVFESQLEEQPHLGVGVRRLFDSVEFVRHLDTHGITEDVDTPEQWESVLNRWPAPDAQ